MKIHQISDRQQHTPDEVLELLNSNKTIKRIVCIYTDEGGLAEVHGADDRKYLNGHILWDVEVWKHWFMEGDDE